MSNGESCGTHTSLRIADRLSVEVFDEIAANANQQNPAQAVLSMLLGFYPLAHGGESETEGSRKLRQTRHWSTVVVDTEHLESARERLAAQLSRVTSEEGFIHTPITLKFFNFDFATGEVLAYLNLPREKLMNSCAKVELHCLREGAFIRGNDDPSVRRLGSMRNPDIHVHLLNSPLRLLLLPTRRILHVLIDLGCPRVYVDGGTGDAAVRGLLLPEAPELQTLVVTGTISPELFQLGAYPQLQSLSFDIPVDLPTLLLVATGCTRLQFLKVHLWDRERSALTAGTLCFPSLITLVATSSRVLSLIGRQAASPALQMVLVADSSFRPDAITSVFNRPEVNRIGPFFSTRAADVACGIIECLRASENALGVGRKRLVLDHFSSRGIWSFTEAWVDENVWPRVDGINIERCELTGTAALEIVLLARRVVPKGGEIRFTNCYGSYTEGQLGQCHDSWQDSLALEGRSVLAGHGIHIIID